MANYQRLPTPLPPPPRLVRENKESNLGSIRLLLLGISIAGLAALFYLMLVMLWASYGTNTTGHVVGTRVSHGKTSSYYIEFTYAAPDGPQTGEDRVDQLQYYRLQNGSPDVLVRYLVVGPFHYSGLVEFSDAGAKSGLPVCLLLFLGVGAIQIWLEPAQRRLMRTGLSVFGAITEKRTKNKKNKTQHFVKYGYRDARGQNHQVEINVTNVELWQTMEVGQVVNVLVHRTRPNRAMLYELSRYRVDGMP